MDANRVRDRLDLLGGTPFVAKDDRRVLRADFARQVRLGVALRMIEELVQEGGCDRDERIGPFGLCEDARARGDAPHMEMIVRSVGADRARLGDAIEAREKLVVHETE